MLQRRQLVIIVVAAMIAVTALGAVTSIDEDERQWVAKAQAFTNDLPGHLESPALRSRSTHLSQRSDTTATHEALAFVMVLAFLTWTRPVTAGTKGLTLHAEPRGRRRLQHQSQIAARAPPQLPG